MSRPPLLAAIRFGGLAASAGGAFWTAKALAILVTGVQPPLLFEIAPVLFAGGLIALYARLKAARRKLATVGGVLAVASGVLALLALIFAPTDLSEESFSPWISSSFLTNLAALVVLGVVARKSRALPATLRWLPLALGVSTIPLLAVGGALETIHERLLEIPLVLLGLGWIWLGYLVGSSEERRTA